MTRFVMTAWYLVAFPSKMAELAHPTDEDIFGGSKGE